MGNKKRTTAKGNEDKEKILDALKRIIVDKESTQAVAKATNIARTSLRRYKAHCESIENFFELTYGEKMEFVEKISSYKHPTVRKTLHLERHDIKC